MNKGFIIAIDGPVASGKGTFSLLLAEKLAGFYLYTGAMYRGVALACFEKGIDVKNPDQVKNILPQVNFEFKDEKVFLNGKDITEKIKEPEIARAGSVVARYPLVREDLVKKQQEIAKKAIDEGRVVVAEGRDTTTVVFPNAALKVFLTASDEIRAKRRLEQYKRKGIERTFEEVYSETKQRDESDTTREASPMYVASDAMFIDTSNDEIEDTVKRVIEKLKEMDLYDKH